MNEAYLVSPAMEVVVCTCKPLEAIPLDHGRLVPLQTNGTLVPLKPVIVEVSRDVRVRGKFGVCPSCQRMYTTSEEVAKVHAKKVMEELQ